MIITILAIMLVAVIIYSVIVIFKLQKKCVEYEGAIEGISKNNEQLLHALDTAKAEIDRWQVTNIGYIGDIAYLIESNDSDAKLKVKRKWKNFFNEKKKMMAAAKGLDKPEAQN